MDYQYGFEPSIFTKEVDDQFICPICTMVCIEPQECRMCAALFCKSCVSQWFQKNKDLCPRSKCDIKNNPIKPVEGALLRLYKNLEIKCQKQDCNQVFKLVDFKIHEMKCKLEKCLNHAICQNQLAENAQDKYCSQECGLFIIIKGKPFDKEMLLQIKEFLQTKSKIQQIEYSNYPIVNNNVQVIQQQQQIIPGDHKFRWDVSKMGKGLQVSNNNLKVILKEGHYVFRSIISDTPMMQGCHYWEIIGEDFTENELKIGIVTRKEFNMDSAFCDYHFGFAYYGLGQLRLGSNAAGGQYGKKFKNQGTLGVFLNMNKGSLAFAKDGEYWGVAFTDPQLKKGPVYAAVALLHCAGCTLATNKPIPSYFEQ